MQKWEYCVITGLIRSTKGQGFEANYPRLCMLTSKGVEVVKDFQSRPSGGTEADAIAQAIAQLGEEGWELVATGGSHNDGGGFGRSAGFNTLHTHALYFKRPTENTGP